MTYSMGKPAIGSLLKGFGFLLGVMVIALAPVSAAVTDEQKCKDARIKAAGKYYFCRMKVEAKAVKKGLVPDYAKCDQVLDKKFAKIAEKFASPSGIGCGDDEVGPATVDEVRSLVGRDTSDMTCRFDEGNRVRRLERPSTIVTAAFLADPGTSEPTLTVRNYSNFPWFARCFFIDDSCGVSSEFTIQVPFQGKVEWDALSGSSGIPAITAVPFTGELVCVLVDDSNYPIGANALVASATDEFSCARDGDGLRANELAFDQYLCLGGSSTSPSCPSGAVYESCEALRGGFAFSTSLLATCADVVTTTFTFDCR